MGLYYDSSNKEPLEDRMGAKERNAPGRVLVGLTGYKKPESSYGPEPEAGRPWGPGRMLEPAWEQEVSHQGRLGQWAGCTSGGRALTFTEREAFFSNCLLSDRVGASIRKGRQAQVCLSARRQGACSSATGFSVVFVRLG